MTHIFSPAKLRSIRESRGLSRLQLAMSVRRNFHQVGAWERGRDVPRTETLLRLAEVLECQIDDLFEEVKDSVVSGDGVLKPGGSRTSSVKRPAPVSRRWSK